MNPVQCQSPYPELDELLELRHLAHAIGLASHHHVSGRLSGLYASIFRGQGLDYEESREYREGDDVRNMDWRVTARTGVGHLKIFREERERSVLLCVDCRAQMIFGTRGTFKSVQAARATALLGWSAINCRDRVGALLVGDSDQTLRYFRPNRSRQVLWRILRSLGEVPLAEGDGSSSKAEPKSKDNLISALQTIQRTLDSASLLFLIADFNREVATLKSVLSMLTLKHELVLIPIDDPADWQLPAMGRVGFHSCSGQHLEIDTDNKIGRHRYQQSWERRRKELQKLAYRLGSAMIPLRTDRDIRLDLIQGLQRYGRNNASLAGHG